MYEEYRASDALNFRMYGDYECMRYGRVADCLVDLTGGMPERYLLRDLHVADNERTRERLKAALADALGTHSLVMLTSDKAERSPAQVRWANDARSARASTARGKEDEDGECVDYWATIANKNNADQSVNSPRSDDERSDEGPDDEEEDSEGEEDGEENDKEETEGTASGNVSRSVSARSRGVQSARRKPKPRPSRNPLAGPGPLTAHGLVPCRGYILEGTTELRVGIGKKPATVTLLRLCNPWNDAAWNGPWSAEYVHWFANALLVLISAVCNSDK